jgi:hypothetical protein
LEKCITSRCSITPALRACVGQFLSRAFVVLLRKSIPQNHNLKTAAELGVMGFLIFVDRLLKVRKSKRKQQRILSPRVFIFRKLQEFSLVAVRR